ncbi:Caleosin [Penicillium occitanis (nom. inval.)]|nr:Caleosin [Penicillium occitanis (nom. inval.)]PCG96496.1 hypothetical protein PENOC_072420 [Penicillium occitanis (nom. inval.)]
MAQKFDGINFDVSVDKSVVTQTRIPAINTDSTLDAPSVVRANQAVSREHPEGSVKSGYSEKHKDYTHGSDSGTYDNEGRFAPQNFENVFAKYDSDRDGAISLSDIFRLMKGQRVAADPFGWGAALFEWGTTWLLLQKDGKVYKEDLRQLYDGSLFWRIREQRKQPKGWQQGYGLGGDGFVGSVKVF